MCSTSCCMLCSMSSRTRKTINFDAAQTAAVAPFLEEGTEEHSALERLVGRELVSDSEELAALVELGAAKVRQAMLAAVYESAVDDGAFDETRKFVLGNRGRRRPAAS